MKYAFVQDDTRVIDGHTLIRIRRLSDNMPGGYVETADNLSQDGSSWIHGDSVVYGAAAIRDDAQVYGTVHGQARVENRAIVRGAAYDNAIVREDAQVFGQVFEQAVVEGRARVYGVVRGLAHIGGDEVVFGVVS